MVARSGLDLVVQDDIHEGLQCDYLSARRMTFW